MTLLKTHGLSVFLGNSKIVKEVNVEINSGEYVALIGPSGCGKTTLARAILKLDKKAKYQGQIIFNNMDLLALDENKLQAIRGGKIAMIFQEPMLSLNPLQTVEHQIREVLQLHHLNHTTQHIEELLRQVDLVDVARIKKSYPHQLSGGQRQRVMIAMALAGEPELLIADEPTTALDFNTQTQILQLLQHLQKKLNLAILFITHDISIVSKMADRVYVMDKGIIVDNKAPDPISFGQNNLSTVQSEQVLSVQNLSIQYGKFKVISDLSFDLKKGETLGLVGPSGCGKSSIGLALTRLIDASGQVIINGQDFLKLKGKELKQMRSTIQMVFQDPFSSLNPRWMVEDIILEGGRIHKLPNLMTELEATLNKVHLPTNILNRYPHELSGGQRVRVALARALLLKPQILILDEITTALDVNTQRQVIDLLKEMQEKIGLSYIFITHDRHVLEALAHRIIDLTSLSLSLPQP